MRLLVCSLVSVAVVCVIPGQRRMPQVTTVRPWAYSDSHNVHLFPKNAIILEFSIPVNGSITNKTRQGIP